jgi:uncharacterized membrane protein YphA (DoxX/SURF4 family)
MKIHQYMALIKLFLLVDLQQKVGELVLSITSCFTIIILRSTLNYSTEKIDYGNFDHHMIILFTCMHFLVWGILRKWSARAQTAYEVVRECRYFEKHCSN